MGSTVRSVFTLWSLFSPRPLGINDIMIYTSIYVPCAYSQTMRVGMSRDDGGKKHGRTVGMDDGNDSENGN